MNTRLNYETLTETQKEAFFAFGAENKVDCAK